MSSHLLSIQTYSQLQSRHPDGRLRLPHNGQSVCLIFFARLVCLRIRSIRLSTYGRSINHTDGISLKSATFVVFRGITKRVRIECFRIIGQRHSCWSRQDNSHCSFECGAYEPLYTRGTELIQD